jgi:hypothetical protein
MFCEAAKIFELIRKDKPNFCYWSTLTSLKMKYYYQLCDVTGGDHLIVDIERFKKNMNLFLSNEIN